MTTPSIGVVVATRDGRRFIGEQLGSILAGVRPPDRVIVTDDDSGDETVALARDLLQESGVAHEIVVNRPALGVAGNVANAVARLDTDVVVLSDQDDRWHRDRLAAVAERFADPEVVLAHGDADLVDADGNPLGGTLFGRLEVSRAELRGIAEGRAYDVYLRRNLATGATMAVRRAAIADALHVPEGWVHDEWFAIVAATRGRVVVETAPLIDYRLHGANQIGAAEPTLARKVRRVLSADAERLPRLATRFEALTAFLEATGASPGHLAAARAKAAFEARRAALPRVRVARAGGVLHGLRRGDYARFASRGRLDAVRDLLQPR